MKNENIQSYLRWGWNLAILINFFYIFSEFLLKNAKNQQKSLFFAIY